MKLPRLTGWSIRIAFGYLFVGFTLGALLLWQKGLFLHPSVWLLLPAHIDFLLIGWTVQLTLAIAFWIMPRFGGVETKRGNVTLAWMAFILLNAGVLLVAIAPFTPAQTGFQLAGRIAEAAAALIFVVYAWPRIKPWGKRTVTG